MKNNLVVIPFDIPWDWSTDYTNQTARILSGKNKVLCLLLEDSFSIKEYLTAKEKPKVFEKYAKNYYLFRPLQVIPFRRLKAIHNLNISLNLLFLSLILSILNLTRGVKDRFLWIFHPKLYPVTKYFGRKFKTVFDCVDFFDYGTDEKEGRKFRRFEEKLTKEADFVTANSKVLLERLKKYRKNVHLVPQGFRVKHFEEYEKKEKKPRVDLGVDKKKPVIGFVGGVNHRLDFDLLGTFVKDNPQLNFVLWGPVQKPEKGVKSFQKKLKALTKNKNLIRGVSEKEIMPAVIQEFDVGVIPYDKDLDFNRYCYPMKIFEYFFMSKPVVSTTIEELKRFPDLVEISDNPKEWSKLIKKILKRPWPEEKKEKQRRLAIENSWENKVKKIVSLIKKA